MLRRIVNWLLLAPIAILVVVLAVANREPVTLSLDPFALGASGLSFSVPLFAVVILSMILGVAIGGATVWWKQGRYRKRCRTAEHDLATARIEIERLRTDRGRAEAAPGNALALMNRPAA